MKRALFLTVLVSMLFAGCKKDEDNTDYSARDKEIIEQYIADHNLNAKEHESGLYYVIDKQGNGPKPTEKSTVTVHYKGYFTDGKVFDSSLGGNPRTFNLQNVIRGWQIGIPLFNEGGEGMLLIPSALGYGSSGTGNIPPNSVLIFDIELIDVL